MAKRRAVRVPNAASQLLSGKLRASTGKPVKGEEATVSSHAGWPQLYSHQCPERSRGANVTRTAGDDTEVIYPVIGRLSFREGGSTTAKQ